MTQTLIHCDHCRGPILPGHGMAGRSWGGHRPRSYCCAGCLSLGERRVAREQASLDADQGNGSVAKKLDPIWIRFAVALILTGQTMALGLAINLTPPEGNVRSLIHGLLIAITLAVFALLGGPLVRATIRETCRRRVTIEALFLLGLTAAFAASLLSVVQGRGPVYFEVVSILLLAYTFGKALIAQYRASAIDASRSWMDNIYTCHRIRDDGGIDDIPVAEVEPGTVIEVRPGELIPVDGCVRTGSAFVQEAALTGEAFPVVRRAGDPVWAGTCCEDARLIVEATAPGDDRRIDRILAGVEEARRSPTTLQAQADRLAAGFLPIVVTITLGTFAAWTWLEDWRAGVFNALSVLLVACPCALGLATPLAVWTAIGRLAELGLIVRRGDLVERLATTDCVVFDKTGTLTEDQTRITDLVLAEPHPDRRRDVITWIHAVERLSGHPIARGFARLAEEHGVREAGHVAVHDLRVDAGRGLSARIEDGDGHRHAIRIGSPAWLVDDDGAPADGWTSLTERLHGHDIERRVAIEIDGAPAALATWQESVRDSTEATVAALRSMGMDVQVLTGDSQARCLEDFGDRVLVRVGCSPEEKRAAIDQLVASELRPLFVGDGINDGPAMAAAHAGVALATGTDLAQDAATGSLYRGDLRVIPAALAIARQSTRVVRENILFAMTYNGIAMTLGALGVLHPVAAALLMVVSSLLVVWRSSRASEPLACDCHVDAGPIRTGSDPDPAPRRDLIAATHALAITAIGALIGAMAGLGWVGGAILTCVFAAFGAVTAWSWRGWYRIPTELDMAYGMAGLGTLGMVLGWWADMGFRTLPDLVASTSVVTCHGFERNVDGTWTLPIGMWAGMYLFSHLAMYGLRRRPDAFRRECSWASLTLGYIGMGIGMVLGGAYLDGFATEPALTYLTAMTGMMCLGMTLGMIAGHQLGDIGLGWRPDRVPGPHPGSSVDPFSLGSQTSQAFT